MMNRIDNFNVLFNGNDKEVVQALREKANWINHKYLIPGNLNQHTDEEGKSHYTLIEAMYDGTFIFEDIKSDLIELTKEENELVTNTVKDFAKLTLYCDFDEEIDAPFWLEYDFTKLEKSQFNQLFPNFYTALPLSLLNLNFKGKNLVYECLKCVISGKTLQNSIILSKNDLFNLRYHCPILSKIYVKKGIDPELLETLGMIALKYQAEVEEIEDEQ